VGGRQVGRVMTSRVGRETSCPHLVNVLFPCLCFLHTSLTMHSTLPNIDPSKAESPDPEEKEIQISQIKRSITSVYL
jgi:hypothetical protein